MRYALFALTFIVAGSSAFQSVFNINTPYIHVDELNGVETTTDSTKPVASMSVKEKMDAHVIHFTGAVMSDTFVVSHFSRAFVADQYSDFLKPGKYNDGNLVLPKSIATSLDGIAIPKKNKIGGI